MGLPKPQCIGCQHHILDRLLKHIIDFYVDGKSMKPTLNYEFVDELQEKYAQLQLQYVGQFEIPKSDNPGWRDDFKFLFDLCKVYRHYKSVKKFPVIVWKQLPSLHSQDGILVLHIVFWLIFCCLNGGKNWN